MARPTSDAPKTRLNLEIQTATRERIEALRERIEADSMTEVIRRAVKLLWHVVDAQADGAKVVIRKADGTETKIVIA